MNELIMGHTDFVRCDHAIVNTNIAEYELFMASQLEKKKLETKVNELEKKIDLILSLLQK